MIEQTKSYKTTDGAVHPTIESAKTAELKILLASAQIGDTGTYDISAALATLTNNSAVFADILSMKERKKRTPKAMGTSTPATTTTESRGRKKNGAQAPAV